MYKDVWGKEHRYGPPAGWVRKDGTESISQDEFQKIILRGLHFPDYVGPSNLLTTNGNCLHPLVREGKIYRTRPVAPDEDLIDGALYVFECDWKGDSEAVREYCEKMGAPMGSKNVIMKFLRFVCGEWWYVCNQGIGKLSSCGGVAVLAMVVGVVPLAGCNSPAGARQSPCGNPFDALSIACNDTGDLGLNAATSVSVAGLSGAVGSFTTPNTMGSVSAGPFPYDTSIILTVTGQWQFLFSGGTLTNIVIRYGISTTTLTFTGALVTVDQATSADNTNSGLGPLSQEIEVPLAANTTATYHVLGGENPSGIIGAAITFSGTLKAEVIKR